MPIPCLLRNLPSEFCDHILFLLLLRQILVTLCYPEYLNNIYFLNENISSSEEGTWLQKMVVISILIAAHGPTFHQRFKNNETNTLQKVVCLCGKIIEVIIIFLEECTSIVIICDTSKACSIVPTDYLLFNYVRGASHTNMFYFSMFIRSYFSLFLKIIFSLKLVFIGNRIYFNIKTEIRTHTIGAVYT